MLLATLALIWAGLVPLAAPLHGTVDRFDLLEVVLCAEGGPGSSVWLDAAGQPVDRDQSCEQSPCPACLVVGDANLLDAPAAPGASHVDLRRSIEFSVLLPIPLRWRAPMSHGPPSMRDA
jgi:hypothetical protein